MRIQLSWTLVLLAACSGADDPSAPPAPRAASMLAASNTWQSGVVDRDVAVRPSVIVRDEKGARLQNVVVTFVAGERTAMISGATQVTDIDGVATLGSWTLGKTLGTNKVTATTPGLPSITFQAQAVAAAPSRIEKLAGDNQTGTPNLALPIPASVMVRDSYGNPVRGVEVTFQPSNSGGAVNGPVAVTDDLGVATMTWVLGPTVATNTLRATAGSSLAVEFTAQAAVNCGSRTPYPIGSTKTAILTTTDRCAFPQDQDLVAFHDAQVAEANIYVFRQSSSAFDTKLFLFSSTWQQLAYNDNARTAFDGSLSNSEFRAYLPVGSYIVGTSSTDQGGSYQLSSAVSADVTGCDAPFIVRGVSVSRTIQSTDCQLGTPGMVSDYARIYLAAGEQITISMQSAALDSYIGVWDEYWDWEMASNDNRDASTTDAQLTFEAHYTGYYTIQLRPARVDQTGAYTVRIQ